MEGHGRVGPRQVVMTFLTLRCSERQKSARCHRPARASLYRARVTFCSALVPSAKRAWRKYVPLADGALPSVLPSQLAVYCPGPRVTSARVRTSFPDASKMRSETRPAVATV